MPHLSAAALLTYCVISLDRCFSYDQGVLLQRIQSSMAVGRQNAAADLSSLWFDLLHSADVINFSCYGPCSVYCSSYSDTWRDSIISSKPVRLICNLCPLPWPSASGAFGTSCKVGCSLTCYNIRYICICPVSGGMLPPSTMLGRIRMGWTLVKSSEKQHGTENTMSGFVAFSLSFPSMLIHGKFYLVLIVTAGKVAGACICVITLSNFNRTWAVTLLLWIYRSDRTA